MEEFDRVTDTATLKSLAFGFGQWFTIDLSLGLAVCAIGPRDSGKMAYHRMQR